MDTKTNKNTESKHTMQTKYVSTPQAKRCVKKKTIFSNKESNHDTIKCWYTFKTTLVHLHSVEKYLKY